MFSKGGGKRVGTGGGTLTFKRTVIKDTNDLSLLEGSSTDVGGDLTFYGISGGYGGTFLHGSNYKGGYFEFGVSPSLFSLVGFSVISHTQIIPLTIPQIPDNVP